MQFQKQIRMWGSFQAFMLNKPALKIIRWLV